MWDVGGPQLLSNLSVVTAGDIEAASLALSVNTIDLSSSAGNVLVTGDVSDIMGDVRINATLGDVTLSGSEAAQGAVELSAGGLGHCSVVTSKRSVGTLPSRAEGPPKRAV